MKGIIIAGMRSGGGKTAITCMFLSALKKRKISVRPFKVGPDYIDPGYHQHFCDVPSQSLDTWLLGEEGIASILTSADDKGLGVVEGVMGLFDGRDAQSDLGSTLEMARILKWPVVLLVPSAKAGRSLLASLRGFVSEAAPIQISGLILNQISGESHADYLRQALQPLNIPILGMIPQIPELVWPERHLGLTARQELILPSNDILSPMAEQYLKVDDLIALAKHGADVPPAPSFLADLAGCRIALAQDQAFHFYYPDDLSWLVASGAELLPFSPLSGDRLPEGANALIFGGGFPESFAKELSANSKMKTAVHNAIVSGMPCYAECGGLMYLCEELQTKDKIVCDMVGVIPGKVEMLDRLQNFGYCYGSEGGHSVRGHEFHYSRWTAEGGDIFAWEVVRLRDGKKRREGWRGYHCHASYVHVAMSANSRWMEERLKRGF